MGQFDMFGNEFEVVKEPSRKTKTMQDIYGTIEGKFCRTCSHLYERRQSRRWYKCELWDDFFRGSSEASDIRLKNKACGEYKEKEE